MLFSRRITADLDIVPLLRPQRASALDDERLEQSLYLRESLRLFRGRIPGFADVVGQVVQLYGLALIVAFAPTTRTACSNIFSS